MINEILLAGSFFVGAILVQIIGTLIADKRNHKRNLERMKKAHESRIDYMKQEISFKKRLDFFEKFSIQLNQEYEFYFDVIEDIKEDKKIDKRIQENPRFKRHIEATERFYAIDIYMDSYKILTLWDSFIDLENEIDKEINKNKEKRNLKKTEDLLDKLLRARTVLILKIKEELGIK